MIEKNNIVIKVTSVVVNKLNMYENDFKHCVRR